MENLAPPLELLIHVSQKLSVGQTVRSGINAYTSLTPGSFGKVVKHWISLFDLGGDSTSVELAQPSFQRRKTLEILGRGLRGEAVQDVIDQLIAEIRRASVLELEKTASLLPFKVLLPLLFLVFPAFLLLLFGPLLSRLMVGVV